MLYVCYMFGQHITYFNPFVHRHLSHIMLYGYMFLKATTSISTNAPFGSVLTATAERAG
jgi:hypothetical protein